MNATRINELSSLLKKIGCKEYGNDKLLERVNIALTHISSGRAENYERMEFLGDAVLRLAATEFIDRHYSDLTVGACSNLRAQLVSDRWLADVGEALAIEQHLLLGRQAQGDRSAQSRLRADATEALIGALYTALGNLEAIHRWLTPHWRATAQTVLATPHQFGGKTALQEWSQGRGLGLPSYKCSEVSKRHGDPRRFRCKVTLPPYLNAEGWGGSRREAEQQAARNALNELTGS